MPVRNVGFDVNNGRTNQFDHGLEHSGLFFEDFGLGPELPIDLGPLLLRQWTASLDGGWQRGLGPRSGVVGHQPKPQGRDRHCPTR